MAVHLMRVIAGRAKGRTLVAPRGLGTRPLTDRAREALFSSLGEVVAGARVLDLYAGSGALGIEALSRGAAHVTFVERGRAALGALRRNLGAVGFEAEVVAGDVARFLRDAENGRYQLAFVDPPYALSLASVEEILRELEPLLVPGAAVVLHRPAGEGTPAASPMLRLVDERRYGDSRLWRYEKEER